ncbi:MAG: hypothetical protein R2799_06020 [Crocinitomicaceae bacterium]
MKLTWIFSVLIFSGVWGQQLEYSSSTRLDSLLEESSGIVVATDSTFFTINDSGNDPVLFEINQKGKVIRQITIKAKNRDWEDLAKDELGNVYIGDFGNNSNSRKDLKIYKLPKQELRKNEIQPIAYSIMYPDQKKFPPEKYELYYDCEAFVVRDNFAYLFTKNRTDPFDGLSKVYKVDLNTTKTTVEKIGELQLCKGGWYPCSVTAASYDNGQLLLLTYSQIIRFKNFDFNHPEKSSFDYIPLGKIEQFEAICQNPKGEIILTSEKHKIIGGNKLHKAKIK